jgi:isopenicillin N synthase-like dioxygenase
LEVQNGAGEWVDAVVVEDAFVINIGDMLEVLSNGYYVATMHRVRKVKQERYSFPMFCACDYDTVIKPVESLSSLENPSRYEPVMLRLCRRFLILKNGSQMVHCHYQKVLKAYLHLAIRHNQQRINNDTSRVIRSL